MTEIITTPLVEITSKLNELHAFFIILLIVILAVIGGFGYIILKMIIATKERAEMRNNQIEKAMQSSSCAINAVEELKIIVETHIKEHFKYEEFLKSEFKEFKQDLKANVQDLKKVDSKIFDKIDEIRQTFITRITK